MKSFVGIHQVVAADDYIELALGTPPQLWLGVEGESTEERAARLDAARDILATPEYRDLPDAVARIAAEVIEARAPELFNVFPLPRPARRRRPSQKGAAA
ncbi:hypothetical protein C9F11_27550 [Streptomyces sp. YIM 121038]|uniref:hypothetical protein n=1 Tax=Streptomyces sp. YIM 121038 TaxID=2136401 RepID=UPI001110DDC5|nr:hypothetical protein [Streptomyces sp. YIM 121038]QCX79112.1 hypothetical protein C9F11_27550 [Streptomyces sp. YIM 121038]